ncbi:MAG: gliding motility-associated C-terminal domain-containing protein [Saprospiraceae bacterium]
MLKRFIPLSISLFFLSFASAQRPIFIPVDMTVIPDASRAACDNLAGSSTQTLTASSQSNDKKFLCFNDKLEILHNRDQVLISDPVPATPAGVGYLFLRCAPTKTGITIQDIAADPCILKTPSGATPPGGFSITTGGNTKGDNEFSNDGWLQTNYGSGKPVQLYFAPITFDKYNSASNPSATYEGTPSGACVNVNVAAAFNVVYLNAIKSSIIAQGNLDGIFRCNGGLPEWDNNSSSYAVDISLKTNTTVKGTVNSGPAKHNGNVQFSVPQNGTYVIDVQDGKSCGTTFEMVISSAVDVLVQNDTVCAGSNGKLTIVPSGGSGTYTYTWEKNPQGSGAISGPFPLPIAGTTINNLPIGGYSITVQDTGSGATSPVRNGDIVTSNILLSVTLSNTNPTCPDSFDGKVAASVTGGFGPYYYQWSNGESGSNKPLISNVGVAGGNPKYSVTVTDRFGCTTEALTNLTINQMSITNVLSTNASCTGAKDGLITFDVTGGNPAGGNYNFKWQLSSNPADTLVYNAGGANLFQRDPGFYSVTITDSKGCKLFNNSLEIKENRKLTITKNIVDAKCFNVKDGTISLQVNESGQGAPSSGPVTFSWSPVPSAFQSGTNFTTTYGQVGVGKYQVTVSDNFKCVIRDSVTVKQPASALTVSNTVKNDPTCLGNSANGQITIVASGGTTPYTYAWNKSAITLPTLSNLFADTYIVTVTDLQGCTASLSVVLDPPPGPQIASIQTNNVNCFSDNNGSIKISATKANPNDVLTYKWSNSGSTTDELKDLKPGKYSVTVTDQKGCAIKRDTAITSPAPLELVGLPAITKPSCPTSNDGKIDITVKGGTASYTYEWKSLTLSGSSISASSSFSIPNLTVGTYGITVTDQNNCPKLIISDVAINFPPIITITKNIDKDVDCYNFGPCNGKATVVVTAGNSANGSYSFLWQSGSIGIGQLNEAVSADNLCRGWNRVTITDGKCELVDSVLIGSPLPVGIDTSTFQIKTITCNGGNDGAISLEGKGGVGPYTYNWGQGGSNGTAANLNAGDYLVTVTDSKNCPYSTTITLIEPAALIAAVDTAKTDSVSCARYSDGKITLKYSGGNPGGYAFAWSPNVSTGDVADKLPAGSYSVVVSDAKGCTVAVAPYLITEPDSISFTLDTIKSPLCFGYLTEVKIKNAIGGNGSMLANYTYSIDDGAAVNAKNGILSTIAGTHNIKVYDPIGCYAQQTINVDEPPRIRVYLGQDVEIELGNSYEINATIDAVSPIVKYAWSNSPNATPVTLSDSCENRCAQIIKPLVDGSYILLVEDTLGCMGADTLNITIDRNRNVYLPNAFSPNVDGTNDFFEVFADPQSVEQINFMRVFDRWGNIVFESPSFIPTASRNNGNRWNGYYRDIEANIGVYIYVCEVKFIDGLIITFRGDVMLAR